MSRKPQNPGQKVSITKQTSMHWEGPLPPPGALSQYEMLAPGTAKLILDQWKTESEHRRTIENKVVDIRNREVAIEEMDVRSAHRNDTLSMLLSFGLIVGFVGIAVTLLFFGMEIGALISLCTALALFWKNRSTDNKEKSPTQKK